MDDTRTDAKWITLAEDGPYAGHQIFARVRYPNAIDAELATGGVSALAAVARKLVLKHNDWLSATGQPYPPASEDEFWQEVTQEELLLMLRAINGERNRTITALLALPPQMEVNGQAIDYDLLARAMVRALIRVDLALRKSQNKP